MKKMEIEDQLESLKKAFNRLAENQSQVTDSIETKKWESAEARLWWKSTRNIMNITIAGLMISCRYCIKVIWMNGSSRKVPLFFSG